MSEAVSGHVSRSMIPKTASRNNRSLSDCLCSILRRPTKISTTDRNVCHEANRRSCRYRKSEGELELYPDTGAGGSAWGKFSSSAVQRFSSSSQPCLTKDVNAKGRSPRTPTDGVRIRRGFWWFGFRVDFFAQTWLASAAESLNC